MQSTRQTMSRRDTTVSEKTQTQGLLQQKQQQEKTNIQVFVRARPLTIEEMRHNNDLVLVHPPQLIEIKPRDNYNHIQAMCSKVYQFEKVFGPQINQEQVYNSTVSKNLLDEFLKGYNCSLLAYGMTGSGKTYTLKNLDCKDPKDRGITQRFTEELFKKLNLQKIDYQLRVSYVEVYCEEIYDLLAENQDFRESLKIYEERDSNSKNPQSKFQIQNVTQVLVQSPNDVMKLLNNAQKNLQVAETKMNEHSSRSHAILTFQLLQQMQDPNSPNAIIITTGSESISKSQNDPRSQRQHEASKINKSLLTLGRCITALQKNENFVPLRESKLTRILADSLQGQSITAFIATISLADGNVAETANTLEYMTRAKKITLQLQPPKIEQGGRMLSELTSELNRLKRQQELDRLENGGMWIDNDEWQEYKEWKDKKQEEIDRLNGIIDKQKEQIETEKQKFSITKRELDNAVQQYTKQLQTSNTLLHKVDELKQFNENQTQNINKIKQTVLQNNQVVSSDDNINGIFGQLLQQVEEYSLLIKHLQEQLNKQITEGTQVLNSQLQQQTEQVRNVLQQVIKPQNDYINEACKKLVDDINQFDIQSNVQLIKQNQQQIIQQKLQQVQQQMINFMQQTQNEELQTLNAIQNQILKDNNQNKKDAKQISQLQKVLFDQQHSFLSQNVLDNLNQLKEGMIQLMQDQQQQVRQQIEAILQSNKVEFEAVINKSVEMLISIIQQKNQQFNEKQQEIIGKSDTVEKNLEQQVILQTQNMDVYKQLNSQQTEKQKQYQIQCNGTIDQLKQQLNQDLQEQIINTTKQLQGNSVTSVRQIGQSMDTLYQFTENNVLQACQNKQKDIQLAQQNAGQNIIKLYTNMLNGDKLLELTVQNSNFIKQNLQTQMNQCVQVLKDYYPEIYSQSTVQGYTMTPKVKQQPEYHNITLPGDDKSIIQGLYMSDIQSDNQEIQQQPLSN